MTGSHCFLCPLWLSDAQLTAAETVSPPFCILLEVGCRIPFLFGFSWMG